MNQLINQKASDANIPARHWFAPFKAEEKAKAAIDAISDAPRGATTVIIGPRGTGKTQVAVEVARLCLTDECSVEYLTPVDLFLALRSARRWASELGELETFNRFAGCQLLIVDEIGQSIGTPEEAAIFFRLIDKRYSELKRTILIGNFPASSLESVLGPSIVSRVGEGGGIIDCTRWPIRR